MKILFSRNILLLSIISSIFLYFLDFLLYGSGISGDTPEYLSLAGDVFNLKFPHSALYLPGFPVLVGLTAKLGAIKIFQAATIWMGFFYIINLIFIYKICNYFKKLNKISSLNAYFLFFIMISWWSFRIQKATHADAMYYCLLIILTYFTIKSFLENHTKNFFKVGIILAIMCLTKYNSYILISIFGLLMLLNDYPNKIKAKYLALSILPSIGSIIIWKVLNGGFIYALNASNYENNNFSFKKVLDILYINTSSFGKTLVELFINPIVGRVLNANVGFIIGVFTILILTFFAFKYRKSKLEFVFITFAFIYLISLIFIQSINLVSEINIRTLLTFNFFIFLLIGLKIQSHKNLLFGITFFFLLLLNNLLMTGKWLYQTSKENSFKYEYIYQNEAVFKNSLFLKNIENKEVLSNISEKMLFHINYQKHIKSFKTDRLFYKGKFVELKSEDLQNITNDLKTCIENKGVVVFSNSKSENDKLILEDLATHKFYFRTINNLIIISKLKLSF